MFFGFLCMSSSSALAADSHIAEEKTMSFSLNEQGYQFEQVKTVKGAGEFEHSNSFSVEVDGVIAKNIISIKGGGSESGPFGADQAPNAASNQPTLKGDVKLLVSREFELTKTMSTWETAVLNGKNDHKTITVLVYRSPAKEPARAEFTNCRPVHYFGPEVAANSFHMIESVEVYCTGWQAELN